MKMSKIQKDDKLDWKKIKYFLILGLIAAIMVLIGDMLLGFTVGDNDLAGLEKKLSAYLSLSDKRIFWSSILGFIGIPLEGLGYFGIYSIIKTDSQKYAHSFRNGILGYMIFGGCGVHVPCLACVFFYKYMMKYCPENALDITLKFGLYFLLPGIIMFLIFYIIMSYSQIVAFAKGMTPYPRWCWVFSLPVGMAFCMLFKFTGNNLFANAITAAWISIANIWMFVGLLVTIKKARNNGCVE